MMLSVILLSAMMILLSILRVIRYLICGNNLNWPRDTADWGKKWLVDFNAGKTQLVWFDGSNNTGSIDVKVDGSVFDEEKYLLRCQG